MGRSSNLMVAPWKTTCKVVLFHLTQSSPIDKNPFLPGHLSKTFRDNCFISWLLEVVNNSWGKRYAFFLKGA